MAIKEGVRQIQGAIHKAINIFYLSKLNTNPLIAEQVNTYYIHDKIYMYTSKKNH